MNKILKLILIFIGVLIIGIIFANSSYQLLVDRHKLLPKFGYIVEPHEKWSANPKITSERQIPPLVIEDLKLSGNEHKIGKWSSPFDWPLVGIHSVLLPNEKVMTFGSYSIVEKEDKDIRANKKITLSDGRKLDRDGGDFQWFHHDALAGTDFDIWDPLKGVGDDSHNTILKPINLDAFCSVVRVFDEDTVFLLGGNIELTKDKNNITDYQYSTTFFKISDQTFLKGQKLEYPRWYGSIVRLANDNFVIFGGEDVHPEGTGAASTAPEILEKKNDGSYAWRVLKGANSDEFFGLEYEKWNYPKSYLTSNGDIFGISYNKMWLLSKESNYENITGVGEIELAEDGGIYEVIEGKVKYNNHEMNAPIKLVTISSPVGYRSNSVLMGKDKLIMLGGIQKGDSFAASNQVKLIDFSDTKNVKVTALKSMNYARNNSNTTILPNGELFVNGGSSSNEDLTHNVLTPEIYNFNSNRWTKVEKQHFRRNYHASSLLLPNGSVLVTGGDVWNAEIYYPPYLFEENNKGESIIAKRPKILNIKKIINGRDKLIMSIDNAEQIKKISLISTGSKTHAQGSEPKFALLDFVKLGKNTISVKLPENKNFIQNGSYMLFAINNKNVPSKGEIIVLK